MEVDLVTSCIVDEDELPPGSPAFIGPPGRRWRFQITVHE